MAASTSSKDGLAKSLNLFASNSNIGDDQHLQTVQYRNRLKTYIEGQKWVHKPHVISPAVCARYGWKCISSQLLECDTCNAKLIPGHFKVDSFKTYKECVEKVQDDLMKSHKELCPWPLTPCPESFVHMLPIHKEVAMKEFKSRFESLLVLGQQLPLVKENIPEKLGLSEEVLSSFLKLLEAEKQDVNFSAIFLASTGWKNSSEKAKSLCCDQCQRTVALLLYNSVSSGSSKLQTAMKSEEKQPICQNSPERLHAKENEVPNGSKSDSVDVSSENGLEEEEDRKRKHSSCEDDDQTSPSKQMKKMKFSEKPSRFFDPLFEHRPWCPWIVESAFKEKKSTSHLAKEEKGFTLPGWELFVKCLLRNIGSSDTSASPLKEQISSARSLLETWSSPA